MQPKRTTWLTIYTSILIFEGRVGYSFYYRHDTGHKSYTGVFKAQITDKVHGEICSLGAALKHAVKALKDVQIAGVTIYTDCAHSRSMLEQFRLTGSVATSDVNGHYVIGLNVLLNKIKGARLQVRKMKVDKEEWLKAALYRKIKRVQEKERKFGSLNQNP